MVWYLEFEVSTFARISAGVSSGSVGASLSRFLVSFVLLREWEYSVTLVLMLVQLFRLL